MKAAAKATAKSAKSGETPMFAGFEWMLAGRYLRSRRREAFISVIAGFSFVGIMLGVATLIIVMAVMNGFRGELLSKILGINGHLLIQPIGSELDDYDAVAARIENLEGVTFTLPFVEGQALVSGPSGAFGALVRGVRETDLRRLPLVSDTVTSGTFENFDSSTGLAIGTRMARQLGVSVGDTITLVSPRGNVTALGVTPRVKGYPIKAIFEIGMSEYDGTIAFMPLSEAQLYFNQEGIVTGIEVFTDDPDSVGRMRELVEEGAGRPAFVSDWRSRNMTFFSALEVERNVMFLILTLIVLVAALNIISGMTMLVKDKGRDIAILRTMGATRGAVMRIFVITGASIGIVGTLAGFALGLVVCLNVESIRQGISWMTSTELFSPELYFLSRLPADMDTGETITVVVMAMVLSLLATLYPAWRAARLDPVEALRYE
ncbi:lipoprotein-releasing ABC transporter permease subunit [Stappia sp. MMSF_3263]|uniref:lipoprotein-releasing ABC transporter permease subunit n=1 Tax=Stappia sp. MMSF_3263 TaxID=3046693 RepID=UPI00273FC50E|nr:lipoprotein-releasing ABC transporter permease subunit [Stappia sp. MMSF_3263]